MDNIVAQMLSLPMLALCMMIWVAVWLQRKLFKMAWKGIENNKIYRDFFLPLGPLGTGALMCGLITDYPYPADITTFWARIGLGIVAGLFSAHVYKMVKPYLPEQFK